MMTGLASALAVIGVFLTIFVGIKLSCLIHIDWIAEKRDIMPIATWERIMGAL